MARFFIEEKSISGDKITVTGSDARHIGYSLRMKKGERIVFCREGTDYISEISKISSDSVICDIKEIIPCKSEPNVNLTIYQSLPKSDKMDLIIQKTVELGVHRIVPFISARTISRPDEKSAEKKIIRFNKISESAAKQSGRGIIPEIGEIKSFEECLEDAKQSDIKIICYENGGAKLSDTLFSNAKNISVFIGAEGGFEYSEIEKAKSAGFTPIYLGERILRCETCPIAITAIIMNLTDNLS